MLEVVQSNGTTSFNFDRTCSSRSTRSPTNMEGTHGQLRARLTDRLCSHNTYRLTVVDHVPACEIATVTHRANTKACLTGNCRTYDHFIDAGFFEQIDQCLI